MLRTASALRDRLEETRWKVGDAINYPFEHADEEITLGKFAFPPLIPAKEDVGGLLEASGEAIDRLARLHGRALGRLVLAAEEVEKRAGSAPDHRRRAREGGRLSDPCLDRGPSYKAGTGKTGNTSSPAVSTPTAKKWP